MGMWGICLALIGCGSGDSMSLDENLSNSLRSQPYRADLVSEIRVYRTDDNAFLTSGKLEHLLPIKVLKSKAEMENLSLALTRGRLSNTTPGIGNFHYQKATYHIIAIGPDGTKYGYLKARISSDPDKSVVAQVQAPDGTGSYEYVTSLPEVLETFSKDELHINK